jgi:hypothetical protein
MLIYLYIYTTQKQQQQQQQNSLVCILGTICIIYFFIFKKEISTFSPFKIKYKIVIAPIEKAN